MTRVQRRGEDGFTLPELLTVVAIIGLLVAIAMASFGFSIERSRRVACLQNQRTIDGAIVVYRAANRGSLPPVTDPLDDEQAQAEIRDALKPYARWSGPDFMACTKGAGVCLTVDPVTGDVACVNHPK